MCIRDSPNFLATLIFSVTLIFATLRRRVAPNGCVSNRCTCPTIIFSTKPLVIHGSILAHPNFWPPFRCLALFFDISVTSTHARAHTHTPSLHLHLDSTQPSPSLHLHLASTCT